MDRYIQIIKNTLLFKEDVKLHLGFKEFRKKTITDYNIGLITSTIDEFESIKNIITNITEIKFSEHDSSIYYSGQIETKSGKMNVIIPFPMEMGIEAAVVTTTKLLSRFNFNFLFMVGIAAGNQNIVKIGDILIAEKSLNYNQILDISNDDDQNKKKYMHTIISIDSYLKSQLKIFSNSDICSNIVNNNLEISSKIKSIKCHLGLIATGSSLLRSEIKIKEVNDNYHNVIGLDMETYGFYFAISTSQKREMPYFASIKSVSDYGDNRKSDLTPSERKNIALLTSSIFLKDFIKNYIE